MSSKRFRIAFSFAGEKREFVAKVARILATQFSESKILYDKYHEAEFAEWKLGLDLPDLYREQSDLIVVVVCQDYSEKDWCGLEWVAIHGMLMSGKSRDVMLSRFEHAKLQGLYENAGFVELDNKSPEQMVRVILERLAINEGKAKDFYRVNGAAPQVVPSTTIPNNLPRLESFFGRTEELRQIAEALDPKTRTWGALIDGPGGQGKTSLAVRAAYDCTSKQFERIVFLSKKNRELDDDGERELGIFILPGFLEMLNELARELHKPDITKAPESERTRLILEALETQRVLLILDNLESLTKNERGQLLTFVKRLPQGCKAILTSRRRIGSGSDLLILQKLEKETALEILADLARHNPLLAKTSKEERISLHKQTGGNPLLLRWTAGQLGRGSCRTIADALTFLRGCPPDNDPLEFIFGDLANEFTDDESQVLAALCYFSFSAKLQHVAEVSGLEIGVTETALRTLANRSLVIPDQEEKAFALVPMVGDFLRSKRPKTVAETGSRLEKRAYNAIDKNSSTPGHFSMLDEAWPVVSSSLPLLISGPNLRAQTVCSKLFRFLQFTGRWDESLSLSSQAEAKALSAGDYKTAGARAYENGVVQHMRGRNDEVLECADRAMKHWSKASVGVHERVILQHLRGLAHKSKGNYDEAIAAFTEALNLEGDRESRDACLVLNSRGDAERMANDLPPAEVDYREALRIARAVNNLESIAIVTGNLALLALDRRDWSNAEKLGREALQLAESLGRQDLIARICETLAGALFPQGHTSEALLQAERAADIFGRLNSPRFESIQTTLDEWRNILADKRAT